MRARFFLASGYMQDGRSQDAVSIWQSLAAELPGDSPWRGAVREALRDAGVEAEAGPGPSGEEMQAAAGLEDEDRIAMIEDMVAGLDTRLRRRAGRPAGLAAAGALLCGAGPAGRRTRCARPRS